MKFELRSELRKDGELRATSDEVIETHSEADAIKQAREKHREQVDGWSKAGFSPEDVTTVMTEIRVVWRNPN